VELNTAFIFFSVCSPAVEEVLPLPNHLFSALC
jgi:hypothetical protein